MRREKFPGLDTGTMTKKPTDRSDAADPRDLLDFKYGRITALPGGRADAARRAPDPHAGMHAAEERARRASERAYRQPYVPNNRREQDGDVYSSASRRADDEYAGPGIAPRLRPPKLAPGAGDAGSPDPFDLSSRNGRGRTAASAYPNSKAKVDPGVGPYRSPAVEPQEPEVDDEMDTRVAEQAALDRSSKAYLQVDPRYSREAILGNTDSARRQGRRADAPAREDAAPTSLGEAEERARLRSQHAHEETPAQYQREAIIARGGGGGWLAPWRGENK
jgi:hypothetical protein